MTADPIEFARAWFDRPGHRAAIEMTTERADEIARTAVFHQIEQWVEEGADARLADALRRYADDPHWQWAFRRVAAQHVRDVGIVPRPLRAFVVRCLDRDKAPTKAVRGRPGGPGRATGTRDTYLCMAVHELLRAFPHLRADRSSESEQRLSACAIVAQATGIDEQTVQQVWKADRRKKNPAIKSDDDG